MLGTPELRVLWGDVIECKNCHPYNKESPVLVKNPQFFSVTKHREVSQYQGFVYTSCRHHNFEIPSDPGTVGLFLQTLSRIPSLLLFIHTLCVEI